VLFLLTVPANNTRGPRYMEKALAAIHQARLRHAVTLSYASSETQVGLFIQCHSVDRDTVLEPIIASYPHATISPMEEPTSDEVGTWACTLRLLPELFPILRHAQFEDLLNHTFADPVSGLLRAILPDAGLMGRIEISIQPASRRRCHHARQSVKLLDRGFFRRHHRLAAYFAAHITRPRRWFVAWIFGLFARCTPQPSHTSLDTSTSRLHEREEDLQAAADKLGGHLFESSIQLVVSCPDSSRSEARERLRRMAGAFGAFTKSRLATFSVSRTQRGLTTAGHVPSFLLSHEELATLWHPPTEAALPERMQSSDFQELEAPSTLCSKGEDVVILGRTLFRDDRRPVGLANEDRRRHLYLVGKTGMGKTTLLQNMLVSDMQSGRGLCLIDPHGDLADSITALVPSHRTNDVILFDAGNRDQIVGFNPLACHDATRIDQVTSGAVSAMKKLYDSWGPRLEDTLRNAVYAIVERGGNLMSVMQLLGEKPYREQVVPMIRDQVVRSFWLYEFASWSDNYRTEAVAAIQNKLRPFVVNSTIRAIVTHPNPAIDFRRIMDDGKVLIVNLSKGRLGEDNSTLLGALLVTSIQQAAMTRADIPETDRRDFSLYVDEFQNFTTGSFASVLSEARKFRLSLIVAHQYLSQLDDETSDAVFGNVGSIVAFQVGSDDAQRLAEQIGKYPGQIAPENLSGLPKYTAYVRLLIDGMPSKPFSMQTLSPADPPSLERADIIRRVSQRRFARHVTAEPIAV